MSERGNHLQENYRRDIRRVWKYYLIYVDQHVVNILYNVIVSESFISFYVTCNHVTMTVTFCDSYV